MIKQIPELVSRLTIGYVFIESGVGKLRNIPKIVEFFESLHIPFSRFQAPMVSAFELVFGLFVLIGFFTRLSALPLIGIMAVALLTAKAEEITAFSDLLGQSEFLYIVILLWLGTHGSRSLSVDQWICRRKKGAACQAC